MEYKINGICYFIFSFLCFFYSNYWFLMYTDHNPIHLIHQFSYFTNLTTILVGIYCLALSFYYLGWNSLDRIVFNCYIKASVTTYILMVGIGYYIGISKFYLYSWEDLYVIQPQSIFMHFFVPIISGIIYNITPFYGKITLSRACLMTIYPILYLYYIIFYSFATGDYIYPIIDPKVMGAGIGIPIYILIGCTLFWIIGFFVATRNNFCVEKFEYE